MLTSLILGLAFTGMAPSGVSPSSALLVDLNRTRIAHGLPTLTPSFELTKAARLHALDMMRHRFFAHESPNGRTPFDRMHDQGVAFRFAGENIAMAPSEPIAAESLYDSAPHRQNMLDPQFKHVGIAAVQRDDGEVFFVEDFSD